jgi:GreA/GreB family transcription elongation factor
MTVTIVGIDEADLDRGQVSWLSPIAKALMKAHQGDIVDLRAPVGVDQIEVLAIRYGVADRRFGAKPRKNFVDDQAASPSSWKTPRMAVWMAA